MTEVQLQKEASIFGAYIIGKEINDVVKLRYIQSLKAAPLEGSPDEIKLIQHCLNNKWKLPYYDAALGLKNPTHLLKQKLLRMFAILETQPDYTDFFLAKEFPKNYFFKIIAIGFRAVFRSIVGIAILPKL